MAGTSFRLVVAADSDRGLAELRLLNGAGVQLGYREVDFHSLTVSENRALFDLRTYIRLYKPGREAESVAETGVLIAEKVLGKDLFLKLWESGKRGRPGHRAGRAPGWRVVGRSGVSAACGVAAEAGCGSGGVAGPGR